MLRHRRVWRGLFNGVHVGKKTGRTVDQNRGGSPADREHRPGSARVDRCISMRKVVLMIFIYILRGFSTVYNLFTCNLRTVYLQSPNTGRRFPQLGGGLAGSICSIRNKFLPKEMRSWLEGGSGRFARRVGNLLQAFNSVPRVASIMEMDPRFAEIPVLVDGTVQFIDVETLVLKVHVVQEPCNEFLPLTVRAVEGWVEINRGVTAVKSPTMIKHREGEISEAPISELYSSRTLKQWENSLQYPFFRQASRSRLELGDCLQAGCLQGVSEENEHVGEEYYLKHSIKRRRRGVKDSSIPLFISCV